MRRTATKPVNQEECPEPGFSQASDNETAQLQLPKAKS